MIPPAGLLLLTLLSYDVDATIASKTILPRIYSVLDADGDPLPGQAIGRIGSARYRTSLNRAWVLFDKPGKEVAVLQALSANSGTAHGIIHLRLQDGKKVYESKPNLDVYTSLPPAFDHQRGTYLIGVNELSQGIQNQNTYWLIEYNVDRRTFSNQTASLPGLILAMSPDAQTIVVLQTNLHKRQNSIQIRKKQGKHFIDHCRIPSMGDVRSQEDTLIAVTDGKYLVLAKEAVGGTALDGMPRMRVLVYDLETFQSNEIMTGFFEPNSIVLRKEAPQLLFFDTRLNEISISNNPNPRSKLVLKKKQKNESMTLTESLQILPDGDCLIEDYSGMFRRYDPDTGKDKWHQLITHDPDEQLRRTISPDGRWLGITNEWGVVRIFDLKTGLDAWPSIQHYQGITQMGLNPRGDRLATIAADRRLRIWDIQPSTRNRLLNGQRVEQLEWKSSLKQSAVLNDGRDWIDLAWSYNKKRFLAMDDSLGVHELVIGSKRLFQSSHRFNVDGKAPLVGIQQEEKGWTALHEFQIQSFRDKMQPFSIPNNIPVDLRLHLSADATKVYAVASNIAFQGWDGQKNEAIQFQSTERPRPMLNRYWAAYTPFSRSVQVIDLESGKLIRRYVEEKDFFQNFSQVPLEESSEQPDFWKLALSPNGRYLAISEGRHLFLFDNLTGERLEAEQYFRVDSRLEMDHFVWSADNNFLIASFKDGQVLIYDPFHDRNEVINWLEPTEAWEALSSMDPRMAKLAIRSLVQQGPEIVDWLEKLISRSKTATDAEIFGWIKDLDEKSYRRRQAAINQIVNRGAGKEYLVHRSRLQPNSLEVRESLKEIVAHMQATPLSKERLQTIRLIEVLEARNEPQAMQLLIRLAKDEDTIISQHASDVLLRMNEVNSTHS
jgi:WD40 repeat protein